VLKIAALFSLLFLMSCSSDSGKIDHAKFEIEQGNFSSARRYLTAIPKDSKEFNTADSLLKAIENR